MRARLVLPDSTLECPVGRPPNDLGLPNLAVCLQGESSNVVTRLNLHLRRAIGILPVLPPLCADCARILKRSALWWSKVKVLSADFGFVVN